MFNEQTHVQRAAATHAYEGQRPAPPERRPFHRRAAGVSANSHTLRRLWWKPFLFIAHQPNAFRYAPKAAMAPAQGPALARAPAPPVHLRTTRLEATRSVHPTPPAPLARQPARPSACPPARAGETPFKRRRLRGQQSAPHQHASDDGSPELALPVSDDVPGAGVHERMERPQAEYMRLCARNAMRVQWRRDIRAELAEGALPVPPRDEREAILARRLQTLRHEEKRDLLARSQAGNVLTCPQQRKAAFKRLACFQEPPQRGRPKAGIRRFECTCFLCTYHHPDWMPNATTCPGLPAPEMPVEEVAAWWKQYVSFRRLCATLCSHRVKLSQKVEVQHISMCLEVCPETWLNEQRVRVHVLATISFKRKQDRRTTQFLALGKFSPADVQGVQTSSKRGRRGDKVYPSHFYCQVDKKGSIWSVTNYVAHKAQ